MKAEINYSFFNRMGIILDHNHVLLVDDNLQVQMKMVMLMMMLTMKAIMVVTLIMKWQCFHLIIAIEKDERRF